MSKWKEQPKIKKGALHRQLGFPLGEKIPKSILEDLLDLEIGTIMHLNDKVVTITPKLKKRVQFALNAGYSKKKKRHRNDD